jgi:hypothetical protein
MVDIEIMCGCKNRAALTAVVVVGPMVNACANGIRNGNIVAVVIIIFTVYRLSIVAGIPRAVSGADSCQDCFLLNEDPFLIASHENLKKFQFCLFCKGWFREKKGI